MTAIPASLWKYQAMLDAEKLSIRDSPGGAVLAVKVVPRSSRRGIAGVIGSSLKVAVAAPPEKGRANAAVVALLADRLGVDTSSVTVVSGHGSPAKVMAVAGMDDEAIRAAFSCEKPGKTTGVRDRE